MGPTNEARLAINLNLAVTLNYKEQQAYGTFQRSLSSLRSDSNPG